MLDSQYLEEVDFDQNEKITHRLRDLVRNYPKGLGLIKEFLQNADDAGASTLKVIYDRRSHRGLFNDSAMKVALGPALLFVNDRTFSDDDFVRIQRIGDSGKIRDSKRTGRFGLGFNTSYSVSDNPSLLTRDKIAWFDPHRRIKLVNDKGKNAIAWKIPGVVKQWPDWVKTFYPAGLKAGDEYFDGTVFRLPLRSDIDADLSEISQEPFTAEDFEAILKEIQQVGPPLILFLRSITTLEIREIQPDGTHHLRYWLSTINESEVDQHRSTLRKFVNGNPEELLEKWMTSDLQLPVEQYEHSFFLKDANDVEREETWAIVIGLFRGPDNCLLKDALKLYKHREKAIPWAGAATLISGDRQKRSGGLACFLPLPETVDWPIWLHGWYDLSSNRRGITRSAEVGENTHDRFEWNKLLTEFAVAEAWVRLVEQVAGNAEENSTPYALWPHYSNTHDEVDQLLFSGFYRVAVTKPIILGLSANGWQWYSLNEGVRNLPKQWHDRLLEPFLAEGWAICVPPLDKFVQIGFEKLGLSLPTLTSKEVRDYLLVNNGGRNVACSLTDAPNPMLTKKEWIYALTEFCADGDLDNLRLLPLALLNDNLLHTFTACGTIFLIDDDKRTLLKLVPERVFDVQYQAVITGIGDDSAEIRVFQFNLKGFIECIPEILSKGEPKTEWLCAFFDYLEREAPENIEQHSDALKELQVVPDQYGNWREMGLIETPLIIGENGDNSSKVSNLLYESLTKIGIPLLKGMPELIEIINRFANKHKRYIWELTPNDVAYNLKDHVEKPTLDESSFDDYKSVLEPLLNFLASEEWLKPNDDRLPLLRKIRFLPTTCGQRVAAEEDNVYIPGSFQPPSGFAGKYLLLNTNGDLRLRQFFNSLGVETLDGRVFVEKALLPAFSNATRRQCYNLLIWLRDEFRLVERELSEAQREALRKKIRSIPMLPLPNGGMASFSIVYHPDAEVPRKIFGDRVRIPDMNFFTPDRDLWMEFFHEFHLHRKPLAKDLIEEIKRLVNESLDHSVSAVRLPLLNLINYIRENWLQLAEIKCEGTATFAELLSKIAWLPAIANEDANYAAYSNWPECLWRADQIVPSRLANLVASKYPILDTKVQEFPEAMSTALGLITRVTLPEVFEHFTEVKASLSLQTTESELGRIRRSAEEVYRFVSRLSVLEKNQYKNELNTLSQEAYIFAENKWWNPSRCFFSKLPFVSSWAVSLTALYSTNDQFLRQGLEQLGVRQSPEYDDWLEILGDLATKSNYDVLDQNTLNQARHIMRLLRSAPNEWLKEESILVPLANGKLEEARLCLIPDDLRLGKMDYASLIPLIENNEDSIDVGRRAGARSLRGCLTDRLKQKPISAMDQTFALKLQSRVRSSEFEECLRRIAYEEALRQNDSEPLELANATRLKRTNALEIRIASKIEIESVVTIDDEEIVVFEINDASCFLDKDLSRLWLKERSNKRKMRDDVIRALCDLCELKEQLWLDRILEKEPAEMSKVLDEGEVANPSIGRKWDLATDLTEEIFNDESELTEFTDDNGIHLPEDDFSEWNEDIKSIDSSDHFAIDKQTEDQKIEAIENSQSEKKGTRLGSTIYRSYGAVDTYVSAKNNGSFRQKSSALEPPPVQPGHGNSNPWTGEPQKESRKSNQIRLRSYVHHQEQDDYDTDISESEAKVIGDAGEAFVMKWEIKAGRKPKRMPQNNEGYDIESIGENGVRYIEVKSINGPWGLRGVGVTRAQYKIAQQLGQSWWLYVVEYAKDEANAIVTPIPNPFADRISEYRFDDGWRDINHLQAEEDCVQNIPEKGAKYRQESGEIVTIMETTQSGLLWKLKIKMSDGSTKTVIWSPKWQRI